MVACNPSTSEVKAERLSLRPAWDTQQDPVSKNLNKQTIRKERDVLEIVSHKLILL
jgi:hypothetical protein